MKVLHLANSDLNEKFPVALLDECQLVVARFFDESDARKWAAMRRYTVEEKN